MLFYCTFHNSEPRYVSRILGRRFVLTTAYKYLDIGISVEPVSFVEIVNWR